jgi:hypothetical protein
MNATKVNRLVRHHHYRIESTQQLSRSVDPERIRLNLLELRMCRVRVRDDRHEPEFRDLEPDSDGALDVGVDASTSRGGEGAGDVDVNHSSKSSIAASIAATMSEKS